ncbi:MAG TPA: type II toxin-antitoxin system VapC family toxin [Candidatus Sulfotelmatobacter sp.]|nr:type II toxin-antitoxin system VapC family toxin [Candidatus Sulfotelmatobacter sp.]
MSFLLDTNVLSEWTKPHPNRGLVAWLDAADEDDLFVSAVTFAELAYGVERLPAGRRRRRLESWLQHDLAMRFETRILAVDEAVAAAWGRVVVQRERLGRPIGIMDAFIAATASVHHLTLVTRNAADFTPTLADLVNPWRSA